jgi:hypothetical protein
MSPRARILVWFLIAVYLLTATVWSNAAIPERPSEDGIPIRHDPIEDDPHLRPIFRAADKEAHDAWKDVPQHLGTIHGYWGTKKRILRDKYGIEWRTPAELNPKVAFD